GARRARRGRSGVRAGDWGEGEESPRRGPRCVPKTLPALGELTRVFRGRGKEHRLFGGGHNRIYSTPKTRPITVWFEPSTFARLTRAASGGVALLVARPRRAVQGATSADSRRW